MFLAIGLIIGLVLGLTGAGGSVFAVPLLLLSGSLALNDAIGLSLATVAVSAAFGWLQSHHSQQILWTPVLLLSLTGILLAPVGQWLGLQIADHWLMLGFALLAAVIGLHMLRSAINHPTDSRYVRASTDGNDEPPSGPLCRFSESGRFEMRPRCMGGLLSGGAAIGLLSGLFGVGGGFLIVPLLLKLSLISMRQAVVTSLVVITLVTSSGFISYLFLRDNLALPFDLLIMLIAGGLAGMLLGRLLSQRLADARLQQCFAIALWATALWMLWQALHFAM